MDAEGPPAAAAEAPVRASGQPNGAIPILHCRDCPLWYGGEDDGWGPCLIKHGRGDQRYLTYGGHVDDENYFPPGWPGTENENAAGLSGVRSTSSASAVGYSSMAKAGNVKRRASRRSRSGASSTRRRARLTR
jgi:hypothetical protein